MLPTKRLQVFVSSTYEDLKIERQAAVEAILSCGHIPAGMELFTSNNLEQMEVIKTWIRESDIFLLILGGRYGSINEKMGKSYIHLEYEYAKELKKPYFSVVINNNHLEEKVKKFGSAVKEGEYFKEYMDFKKNVISKMVKFWSDPKDIKLAIHETLADFSRRTELVGWIKGENRLNISSMSEELTRLSKENSILRKELSKQSVYTGDYGGLSYQEIIELLDLKKIDTEKLPDSIVNNLDISLVENYLDNSFSYLDFFIQINFTSIRRQDIDKNNYLNEILNFLKKLSIVRHDYDFAELSEIGQKLINKYLYTTNNLNELYKNGI